MASNFKFRIFNGSDPVAQYNAVAAKDPMTFYLLANGIGYLGETKLFDATDDYGIITDMLGEDYAGNDTTYASTKAIVDYVTTKVNDAAEMLTVSFFRKVVSHTLTEADFENEAISIPEGCAVGDVGLLFTSDTDAEDGGETYYFISLVDYLQHVNTFESTSSIELVADEDNKVTANLKIKSGEESIKIDTENGGVYIEKAATINDAEGQASAVKLVTEQALVNYIVSSIIPAINNTINTSIEAALVDVITAAVEGDEVSGE